jgi:alkanesulfonate monooxygenase SsuD/methylene tetrahydromethanopterin reductase-like flavin-dependent oxidoreductase (luciferase family)
MHPLEVAKKIVSLNHLFPNQVSLNLVTGSFFNEMKAVNDHLSLSERSLRLKEFYTVLSLLLSEGKVSFEGDYYHLNDAELYPKYKGGPLKIFISGTLSEVFKHDDHIYYVKSLRPLPEMERASFSNCGLPIGVCARPTMDEALTAVKTLYPEDRRGEMLFEISLNNKETPWNVWLKDNMSKHSDNFDFYLSPMKNYWASSPFVVDSYEGVAQKLLSYSNLGYKFFILDYLPEESHHVEKVLRTLREYFK